MRTALLAVATLLATASAPAAAATWKVDRSHSQVGFEVTHLMVSTVRGAFSGFDGTVETDASGKLTKIAGTVDVASVDTKDTKRDDHLRGADFFDIAKFAQMSFTSTQVTGDNTNGYTVTGNLTIRGVTKPVTLTVAPIKGPVKDPWGNTKGGTSLRGKINRKDFGVNWNAALDSGGVVVGDEVTLVIELELNQAA
jgi:polyisoprenoid-binding protein YceI